jgi:hypothetical protein
MVIPPPFVSTRNNLIVKTNTGWPLPKKKTNHNGWHICLMNPFAHHHFWSPLEVRSPVLQLSKAASNPGESWASADGTTGWKRIPLHKPLYFLNYRSNIFKKFTLSLKK